MKTIRGKMLLSLCVGMLMTVAITVFFFVQLMDDILLNQVKQQLSAQTIKAAHILKDQDIDGLDSTDFRFFIKDILFYADYFVLDKNNKIITSSNTQNNGKILKNFSSSHQGYMQLNGSKVLYSEAQLNHQPFRVILYSPLSSVRALYIPLLRTTLLSIGASFIVILFIAFFAVWRMVQPLNRLKEAVSRYEPHLQPNEHFLQADHTEIGELISTFQLMADRLQRQHQYQIEFLQNVSHELKTPLMSIQGYVYAIQDQVVTTDQGLEIITTQSKRLIHMVEKLLQLSRLESVDEVWQQTTIDLKTMAEEAIHLLQPAAQQRHIQLQVIGPSLVIAIAAEQVFQILLNLLQNAVRHTATQVQLIIEPTSDQQSWCVHIDDDGEGLSEEEQQQIFQRFYTGKSGVTGLGLAICQQIATHLQAELLCTSSPLGGARFTFILPKTTELTNTGARSLSP